MNDSFSSWLRSSGISGYKKIAAVSVALVSSITAFVSLIGYLGDLLKIQEIDPDAILNTNFILHFIVICIVLFWARPKKIRFVSSLIAPFNEKHGLTFFSEGQQSQLDTQFGRANENVKIFYQNWLHIWKAWLVLYVIFFIGHLPVSQSMLADDVRLSGIQFLSNAFNNLASIMIIRCFVVLSEEATVVDDEHLDYHFFSNLNVVFWIITGLELFFRSLSIGFFQWSLIEIEDPIVFREHVNQIFAIASGLLACVATAHLAGRFDSKLIGARTIIITLLYTYAGIQLFMRDFFSTENLVISEAFHQDLEIMIFYLALFFKCAFLLFVFWLIETKRLFFYFFAINKIHNHIQKDWHYIREILVEEEHVA